MKQYGKQIVSVVLLLVLVTGSAWSQQIGAAELKKLRAKEDSLQLLAKELIVDSLTEGRMRSDSLFVRTLLRSLQIKNSFYYPFDSVQGISKLYAPDSSFRIFSWTLSYNVYYSRQRAAIQLPTTDGSLKLVPLRDVSEFTNNPMDSIRSRNNWIGAVYYNIIKTESNGKPYYTLFGIDNNNEMSTKKWIEVMTFDRNREPVFGGPLFDYSQDSVRKATGFRFGMEYKKDARTLMNYVDDLGLILVDHLISETDEPDKKWTYIPDGDYEGFKWEKGKWVHVEKVFTQKLKDGEFPMPTPYYKNTDEKKGGNDQ